MINPAILSETLTGTTMTYNDTQGTHLRLPSGNVPFQRLIAHHSILSHKNARTQGWIGDDLSQVEMMAVALMAHLLDEEARSDTLEESVECVGVQDDSSLSLRSLLTFMASGANTIFLGGSFGGPGGRENGFVFVLYKNCLCYIDENYTKPWFLSNTHLPDRLNTYRTPRELSLDPKRNHLCLANLGRACEPCSCGNG